MAYKDSLDGRSTGKVGYEPRPSIKERCIIIHIEINWGNWGVWGQHVRWIDNGVLDLCFIAVFNRGKGRYIDRFENGDRGRWIWSPLQIVGCISAILSARTATGIYAVQF